MKIREIRVQNFRNFGPELRSVKFYDEATGLVRPISVLVGSNGCGKTTLLELMVSLLESAARIAPRRDDNGDPLVVMASGISHGISAGPCGLAYAALQAGAKVGVRVGFEVDAGAELEEPLWIGVNEVGRTDDARDIVWPHDVKGRRRRLLEYPGAATMLQAWIAEMTQSGELRGGVLYLPHNRWIEREQTGSIAPPTAERPWIYRFSAAGKWEESLAQFWVWQNYLDLEQGREGRPNLAPFVETIEEILGRGRKVKIQNGRVRIERPEFGDSVELHQLPSGEQQILTIFGEIIRMLRPGAVILIDEVEISLHPALQRAVLFHLRRLAAKYDLQVILTTHSMEIVSAVAPEEVINLDDMAVVEQKQAQGQA